MSSAQSSRQHHHFTEPHLGFASGHLVQSFAEGPVASSSSSGTINEHDITPNKSNLSGSLSHLQLFADERREVVALPKIEADGLSIASSHPSSPYTSPHIAPRPRLSIVGRMEEITLPPIQAAVPMRRGAVSGASSGPSLPFPPIRLSYEEEDIPSRGPSPTLGKRGSFSMGHSNHVPPGPDVHLPTPVLSGSGERRGGGIASTSSYVASQSLYHGDGPLSEIPRSGRVSEEGHSHFYSNPSLRPGLPWSSQHKTTTSSSLKPEYAEPIPAPFQSSYHPSSTSSSIPLPSSVPPHHRIGQFNDEYQRPYPPPSRIPYQSPQHHPYEGQPRASSSGYRYEYHQREESAMSPGSPRSVMQGENSLSPRTSQGQFVQDDSHAQEMESIVNGKRPRSAPRVMSTQPRIFACTQCPARFARNHDLKRHQRGHLSVRPYPCQWCGKSFSRKDALKRHILVKGCGKNAKGDRGGGKGDGKAKRKRGNDGGQRAQRTGSSGDQGDGHFGDDDDENDDMASEEAHSGQDNDDVQDHQSRSHQQHTSDSKQNRLLNQPYYPAKEEQRNDRYRDSSSFANPNNAHSEMTAYYKRPSAFVA